MQQPAGDPMAEPDVDLLDPIVHATADLLPYWNRMRRADPVHWYALPGAEPRGFWVLSRYADAVDVVRDPLRFTSARGNMLGTLLAGGDPAAGRMLVVTDGAAHTRLRKLLGGGLTARTLAPVVEAVERATSSLVAGFVDAGGGDFVDDVAAQIPLRSICHLLGVPDSDQADVLRWTREAMLTEQDEAVGMEALIARNEILLYFTELAMSRREAPGDDVISVMVACSADGPPLSDEDVLLNCYNLVIGGDETARLAMSGGLAALATHPGEWARLRADPALVRTATEEILRWTAPVAHIGRTAAVDTEIADTRIGAGEIVTVWCAAVNRDPDVFADPHAFDVARTPNRHITFGHGPHFCLGAQLARAEITALLEVLRDTVSDIELTGPHTRVRSTFIQGPEALGVVLRPVATATRPA